MTRTIRLAGADDRPAVEAIVEAAYAPYVPRIGRKPGPMLDDHGALIRQGQVHVLEEDGAIQGLVVLIREDEAMLLHNVAVSPEAHGEGLGRLLLDFAERTAREAGYGALRLYTNEAMAKNIAWYTRHGFVETHRSDEVGFRRVFMTKRLG